MSFQDEITKNFDFLFKDYGFKINTYNADEDLSDFIAIAVGKNISLKFIKDRADFFLDVSSNSTPDKWVSFYKVLGQLREDGLLKDGFKPSNKLNHVRDFLKKNIDLILREGTRSLRGTG